MNINGHGITKFPAQVLINTPTHGVGACACCGSAIYGSQYFASENGGVLFNISDAKAVLPDSDDYILEHVELDEGLFLNIKLNQRDRRGSEERDDDE